METLANSEEFFKKRAGTWWKFNFRKYQVYKLICLLPFAELGHHFKLGHLAPVIFEC